MSGRSPSVLFIGPWGAGDGLTTSSIMPGIGLLLEEFGVPCVFLSTIERDGAGTLDLPAGVVHVPWRARTGLPRIAARTLDHAGRIRQLRALVEREGIGLIMARTSPAGGLAEAVARRTRRPFVVESVEPHADYMVDCGVWRRGGALHRSMRHLEDRTLRRALFLITVAHRYRDRLLHDGVDPGRVLVAPCPVPVDRFRPDGAVRERMRHALGLGDAITGVYAGKFGGMYLQEDAFKVFASVHRHFEGRSKLCVLTPDPVEQVRAHLRAAGLPDDDVRVAHVPHHQVPDHLNAADFAFGLYKRTASSGYLSPVKVGEYWACGLPVLLTRGVGDEDDLLRAGIEGGALFDPQASDLPEALRTIVRQVSDPGHAEACRRLALHHRSLDHTRRAYARVMAAVAQRNR